MNIKDKCEQILEEYLNEPIMEQIMGMDLICHDLGETEMEVEAEYNNDCSYLIGVYNDKAVIAQQCFEPLSIILSEIKTFLIYSTTNKFYKYLKRLYYIDAKRKQKYINKAKKKNKETIYDNKKFGVEVLNYVNGFNEEKRLGDRYGLQNCIMDKLADEDNIFSRIVFILNFDENIFEVYNTVPFRIFTKGSAECDNDFIFNCNFDDIVPEKIIKYINETLHARNP